MPPRNGHPSADRDGSTSWLEMGPHPSSTQQPPAGGKAKDEESDDEFDSESSLPLTTAPVSATNTVAPRRRSEIQELRVVVLQIQEDQQIILETQV